MVKAIQTTLPFRADTTARRHRGQPRSKEANEAAQPRKLPMRANILLAARDAGAPGLICDELAARWKTTTSSLPARWADLREAGYLVWNGKTRATRSGCAADILVLPQFAQHVCQNPHCGHDQFMHPITHCTVTGCPCLTMQPTPNASIDVTELIGRWNNGHKRGDAHAV